MITKKNIDYILFKEALELIKTKKHLTNEAFSKIVSIRASMNKGLPESLKVAFPDVIPHTIPLDVSSKIIRPN